MRAATAWIGIEAWLVIVTVVGSARADPAQPPTKSFPDVAPPAQLDASKSTPPPAPPPSAPPPYFVPPVAPYPLPYPPPPPAPAEKDRRWDRKSLFEGHVAVGGPFGNLAFAYEYAPVPAVGFVGGFGIGAEGVQVGTALRLRWAPGAFALGVEVGWSGGPYADKCRVVCWGDNPVITWEFAHWLNMGLTMDVRTGAGFSFRFFGGVARLLNPDDAYCFNHGSEDGPCTHHQDLPFLGMAFGYAQ